jgi:hypothetical protein
MRGLRQFWILCVITLEAHSIHAQGARWTEANIGLTAGSNPGVRTLAIDHAGSTLYTVTGGQVIFSSTDGGSNWHALGRITEALVVAIAPMSPSTVYAGTLHGVRASLDGGGTWTAARLCFEAAMQGERLLALQEHRRRGDLDLCRAFRGLQYFRGNRSAEFSTCSCNRSYVRCHIPRGFGGISAAADGLPPRRRRIFSAFPIFRVHVSCLRLSYVRL